MHDFWPASGYRHLERTPRGWLRPTDDYLRGFIALPELALVEESCGAEIALHEALRDDPSRSVSAGELGALRDADARANYATFLAFRDALLAAGTLEAYYLGLMRGGSVAVAPPLIDRVVEAIVRHLLDASTDPFEVRAGELLFRSQRVAASDGRMLAADRETADSLATTATLPVLTAENAAAFWARSDRHEYVLDLTHEIANVLDHGLSFTLARTHSGLKALSRVLEKWVAQLLGATVAITPLREIDDPAWRWHIGLDAASMALLNDLYEGHAVDADRLQRLVSLFRLDFTIASEMRADLAGKPVYLGLATAADGTLKLKPQNLLLNLPLAAAQ